MFFPSSSLLYAVYLAYALDCTVGVRLLWKAIQERRTSESGELSRHSFLPQSLILSRALTSAVLTLCLLQMLGMTTLERWICIGLFACSLVLSLMTLAQRLFRSSAPDDDDTNTNNILSSYQFPVNPRFEALWSANPQYYEAGSLRLRKVELPHWRFESPDFTDVLFVLEGIIMVETAIGSPNGAATHHAVDLVWKVAEEMDIRHSRQAVLFTDAYNVRKSSFEARKIAAQFYGEAALIWNCYLFLNPAVRVSFRLSKPFAPSAFRSIRIANSFHEGLRSILAEYSRAVLPENEPSQPRDYSFPINPYFEERWKYSLEYLEVNGVKLRKIQPAEWYYQAPAGEQTLFMLEGAMLVVKVQGQHLDTSAIQTMMQHTSQVLAHNGNKAIPMALTLDFSDVLVDAALLCADVEPILRDVALLSVCCIPSPLLQEKVQASHISIASRAADGTFERTTVTFVPTQEEALDKMLVHFLDSGEELASARVEIAGVAQAESHVEEFHERRIEQIYTLLARIADNEAETLAPPQLPSGDLYSDVFKAMEVVYEDKRRQMQEIMEQKYLLEKQSAHIQEVNTQLSFHNTQLDEQNQQLAALNNEKNELMSIVAHDLKNPIGAMRTMAELIANGQVAQVGEVAENIVGTANRMLSLVGNLLDINRLESGAKVFSCVEIDVAPFIESTMWQYRHAAEIKNITFRYNAETSSTLALADEQAILQIVDNLISNAVKYSPQGKTIFIRIKDEAALSNEGGSVSRSDVLHPSPFLRLEVQDEGEGISTEDMKRLFGKFARLSAQPTGGEHSTGLGLSIVKKMVEAMGGRVWCESVHGAGAMFIVVLPRGS